jgi:predicted outer membrane repeat protein
LTPAPPTTRNFKGLDSQAVGQGWPPDTNGDVGPTYYIEMVNTGLGIFRKSDGMMLVQLSLDQFFKAANSGTDCDSKNAGNPVVVYDSMADRWIVSDFTTTGPDFYECIGVSRSGDPVAGGWYYYAVHTGTNNIFPDNPKLGVWLDGIYMSANLYDDSSIPTYLGVRLWALNRSDLESGATLRSISFDATDNPTFDGSLLPSNLRGATLPPAGRENIFTELYYDSNGNTGSKIGIRKFHVDWATPANSTLSPTTIQVTVPAYTLAPASVASKNGENITTLNDRLMMQNQYRNIGGIESLWLTHSVDNGSGVAAIRWYQFTVTGGSIPSEPVQSNTFSPDGDNRFIPSLAVNGNGDMAIGYSVSSSTLFPAIRYAGRLGSDPLGSLTWGEQSLVEGSGSQTGGGGRWGDYSAMTVDPTDDCTFWYTNEYYEASSQLNWQTRIGSFRLPSCASAPLTLSSSMAATTYGQSVTFTATLSSYPTGGPAPTGVISITDGTNFYASGTVVAGQAVITTNKLLPGDLTIRAIYGGDSNYPSSFDAVEQQVTTNASMALTSSANPVLTGQAVVFTVTVTSLQSGGTPIPSGMVTVTNGSTILAANQALVNGQLAVPTTLNTGGVAQLSATYSGDSTYPPLTTTYVQYVNSNATPVLGQGGLTCDEAGLDAALGQGGYITFDCPVPTTINVSAANLAPFRTITQTTTVDGSANNQQIILSGGNSTQVFVITPYVNFNLKGLTLTKGLDASGNAGGAISSSGNLTVTDSIFSNNSSSSAFGGAIYVTGTATIVNSTFYNNTSTQGGALDNASSLVITGSTFYNNSVSSSGLGGALVSSGNTTIANSTFYNNNSPYRGGAIWSNSPITVTSSTLVNNTADTGGAIRISGAGTLALANSIVANNSATTGPEIASINNVNSMGYNLVKNPSGIAGLVSTDITAEDPKLGPSGNYGGSTPTLPLYWNSPAYQVIPIANCLAVDQRGVSRLTASKCSIGASEASILNANGVSLVGQPNPVMLGQSVTFTTTLVTVGATGTITFTDSFSNTKTVLGTAPLNNSVATFSSNKLAIGTHLVSASWYSPTNGLVSSNVVTEVVTPLSYNLPFLANNYSPGGAITGTFTTFLAFQNTGSANANITIQYYDTTGTQLTLATVMTTVAKYGELIGSNPLPVGSRGTGVIISDQPLAVIVAEATPYGGSAYAVNASAGNTLNAPFAFNNTFGGYTTQLTVFNAGNSPVAATVNFYDNTGTLASAATQSFTVGVKQNYTLDQAAASSNIPIGFNGWAQVSSPSGSQLVAQVLEQNPSIRYVSIVNTPSTSSNTAYAPAIFNNAYGSFITGADIVNPNSIPVTVTVNYYSLTGTLYIAAPYTLPAYALTSIYHGGTGAGNGVAGNGLPNGFAGAAGITAQGGGVIVAVNEFGGYTSGGTTESGTYSAASSGNSTIGLPVIANNGFGYTTGTTIFNTSSQTVSGTLQYYDLSGNTVGTAQQLSIGPNASAAYYQGSASQGLSSGFYGVAVITQTGGPANSLLDTTNAVSANFFYTYVEPTQ